MSRHSSRNPQPSEQPDDPFQSFMQLVTPSLGPSELAPYSVDTGREGVGDALSISSCLVVESLDDVLAEEFPLYEVKSSERLREVVGLFIATVRDEVSRDSFMNGGREFFDERPVSIRFGPARVSSIQAPLVWIEFRCRDTEAYILPSLNQGMRGVRWLPDDEHRIPERFHDGPVRVVLELDPQSLEVARCHPLVSPQCALEAEGNFLVALRLGGRATSSYLLSQYHDLKVAHALQAGELESDPSEAHIRAFLDSYPRPCIVGVSTTSDREWNVTLRYPATTEGKESIESVTLVQVSPWGLCVQKITMLPVDPAL